MIVKNIKYIFLLFAFGISNFAYCQEYVDFEKKYSSAKYGFERKEYTEALQIFEELSIPADNNPFMPYARFYKAKSYIGLGKFAEARFTLIKLSNDMPKWAKKDEVNYLLVYSQLEEKQYTEAKTTIKKIEDDSLSKKALDMFYHFVVLEEETQVLSKLQAENKKDDELVEIIAQKLKSSSDSADILLLNYLIQDYDLSPEKFGHKVGKKKEVYRVALFLPLNLNKLSAFRNVKILNIMKGAEYAVDSLKSLGLNVELKVFDTQRKLRVIESILYSEDFDQVDLILGPLDKAACELVSVYAEENKILNFNYNREDALFEGKEFVYSSISSNQTIGKDLARTAFQSFDTTKEVRIYYHLSKGREDSVIARSYKEEIERLGMKVAVFKAVEKDVTSFEQSLNWTKEKETSHIAVFAHKHNLMASTLISVWESSDKKIPVIAPKEWLDIHLIGYDQFLRRNIHFIYPEYIAGDNKNGKIIIKDYKDEFGVRPSSLKYLAVGFDVMFFVGNQLHEKGTFFHKELSREESYPSVLTTGFDFSQGNTNCNVPLLKFGEEFEFENISKK